MNSHPARLFLLLIGVMVLVAACAGPPPAIPTLMVLPTSGPTAVPTAVLPTITPLVLTAPPILPTATRVTNTPEPTLTPTALPIYVENVVSAREVLDVAWHTDCVPVTTEIQAVVRSVAPVRAVYLKWGYEGQVDSRPGTAMQQTARANYTLTIGPFREMGTVVYWVMAEDHEDNRDISEVYTLTIGECDEPDPPPTALPGLFPTDTPEYGEALSVQAQNQQVTTAHNTPVTVTLTWSGGVTPYTVDRVTQPIFGSVSGVGMTWTYAPNPDFSGTDHFTFRVLDGNDQASTGTITVTVE